MRKILIVPLLLLLLLLLINCSTGLSKTGVATSAATAIATTSASALLGPALGATAGVAAGVAADLIVDEVPSSAELISSLPADEKLEALKHLQVWMAVEKIGIWLILSVIFSIFILPLLIGWITTALRGRKYKNEMVVIKERLFDHPNVTIRDIKK